MDKTQPAGFMPICADFFGKKEGQTLVEFRTEVKALTAKDVEDLKAELTKIGYIVKD